MARNLGDHEVAALKDLDLSVPEGRCLGLVGHNGAATAWLRQRLAAERERGAAGDGGAMAFGSRLLLGPQLMALTVLVPAVAVLLAEDDPRPSSS